MSKRRVQTLRLCWLEAFLAVIDNEGVEAKAAPKTADPRKRDDSPAPRAAPKRKLSFNDQHKLKTLPNRIDTLEAEMTKLNAVLTDSDLYARDPDGFAAASAALAKAQGEHAAAEEEWLRLELLREEIEQSA